MDLSQIIILKCFSNLSPGKLLISEKQIYDLSQFKFDGEGSTLITKHISYFVGLCKYHETSEEYVVGVLFTLTLKGHFNQWHHALPFSSIHSFDQFLEGFHQAFDRYDYRCVLKNINQLRMYPNESIEDFSNRFLHLCYEFPREDTNWDFLKGSLKFCFKSLYIVSLNLWMILLY